MINIVTLLHGIFINKSNKDHEPCFDSDILVDMLNCNDKYLAGHSSEFPQVIAFIEFVI